MLWAGQLLKLNLLIDSDADIDAPREYSVHVRGTESTLLKHGIRVSHRCEAGRYSHRQS